MAGDLSTKKLTHMSTSLKNTQVEYHLRNEDVASTQKPQVDQKYLVVVPVVCTSADKEAQRYRALDVPDVWPAPTKKQQACVTALKRGTQLEQAKKPYSH